MSHKSFKRNILKFIIPLFVGATFVFVNQKTPVQTAAWSGAQTSSAGNYYASVGSETGDSLKNKLKSIISSPTPSTNYDWSRYEAADEAEGASDSVLLIYTRKVVKKNYHVSGNKGWNREHTYPDSKIGSPANKDNHHIFADDNKTNNTRGNKLFGVVAETTGNRVKDMDGNNTDNYTAGNYFMPLPAARGEVARATMYLTTLYNYSITGNFQSIDLMMKWHLENPVTNREIYRNNTVHGLQKNRNPYIDHPEYACSVWGNTNSATQSLCAASGTVEATSVTLSPKTQTLSLLGTTSLQINATVLPSNAANKALNWTSSNPNVATISSSGTLLAKTVGTTTITATSLANSALKDTSVITITNDPINVTGISITNQNVSVGVNKKVVLNTEILPSNATNKSVTWQSSHPAVASVTSDGVVKGLKVGSSSITVRTVDGNKTASILVSVVVVPTLTSVVGDFRNSAGNGNGLENDFSIADLNNGNPGTGSLNFLGFSGTAVVKSLYSSQGYLPRSGGLALGSSGNPGNLKLTLNDTYATKKIDVLFKDAGKDATITMKGSPEAGTLANGIIATTTSNGVPYSLTFTQPQTVFDITTSLRLAIIEIVIYLETEEENPLEEAQRWSREFLDSTADGCATSDYYELYSAWQLVEDSFNDLSEEAQAIIIAAIPLYSEEDDLSHAKARYEVIKNNYGFYGFLTGEDQLDKTSAEKTIPNDKIIYIVVFLLVTLGFSAYFMIYLKKKIHINKS